VSRTSKAPNASPAIVYLPDCTTEQSAQVHALLDWWSSRNERSVAHLRQHERRDYRGPAILEMPLASVEPHVEDHGQVVAFHVLARSLSASGLGFIAPGWFVPQLISDETALINTELAFRAGRLVTVRLPRGDAPALVVMGQVARIRPIHHGFFDIGVRFISRASAPVDD